MSSARNLLARLTDVFRIVEPHPSNLEVFGHELRHLLILACTEVESAMKAVLVANGISPRPDKKGRRRRDYDVVDFLRLVEPMRLDERALSLIGFAEFPRLVPFGGCRGGAIPQWWKDHNKVKHDRENDLPRATMRNVLDALAAVVALVAAQFGSLASMNAWMIAPPDQRHPKWDVAEFYVPPFVPGGSATWTPAHLTL